MSNSLNREHQSDSSAAITETNTYSAEELAKMFMTSRPDFLGLDMESATNNWDDDFIFKLLCCVKEIPLINLISEWIELSWEKKYFPLDDYSIATNLTRNNACQAFHIKMESIKSAVIKNIESKRKEVELIKKMLEVYEVNKTDTKGTVSTTTVSENTNNTQILIENLPKTIQNIIVVSQEIFNTFVRQLNEDTWSIVASNKKKYCDPLRFLCNFHHITKRSTTREEFDELLHAIVPALQNAPSLISSMRRCALTTNNKISRSYLCYSNVDINAQMKKEIWQLVNDCKPLEESLLPVLEAMRQNEKSDYQAA